MITKTKRKQIQEEIINIVDSGYMRNYLLKIQNDIGIYGFIEIITAAPISLEKKAGLLKLLSGSSTKKDDYKQINACYRTAMNALERLYHMDSTKSCLVLTCIDTKNTDHAEPHISDAVLVLSYQDALQYIQKKYLCDMDDRGIAGYDPIADYYFKLDLYDLGEDKTLTHKYRYVCTPSGKVQYFEDMDWFYHRRTIRNTDMKRYFRHWFKGSGMGSWITPYQSGDILYVDRRPYLPPVYCLIYYVDQDCPQDCRGIRCLYPTYRGMVAEGAVKHGHFYPMDDLSKNYISPIFRAELYQGELPKRYAFMKPVSEALKKDPELGLKLDCSFSSLFGTKDHPLRSMVLDEQDRNPRLVNGITSEKMMAVIEGLKSCKMIR